MTKESLLPMERYDFAENFEIQNRDPPRQQR